MADDPTKRGPQDRTRINVTEKYEVDYWKNKFGVSEEKTTRCRSTNRSFR